MMNAGPTQEVTPPSSNVQKSPGAVGKRASPTASPFAPLKRPHCSQSEVKKRELNGSYEAPWRGRETGVGVLEVCWVGA